MDIKAEMFDLRAKRAVVSQSLDQATRALYARRARVSASLLVERIAALTQSLRDYDCVMGAVEAQK